MSATAQAQVPDPMVCGMCCGDTFCDFHAGVMAGWDLLIAAVAPLDQIHPSSKETL